MVEIVFSDSAEGSLRYAQGWGAGKYQPSCVGFAFEADEHPSKLKIWWMRRQYNRAEKKKWENAVVLSGSGADVFALSLGLSIGDIAEDTFWAKREAFLMERVGFDMPPEYVHQGKETVLRRIEKVKNNLEQVCTRLKNGEPMRIWLGTSGEDHCMLAWFAAQLEQRGLAGAKVYLDELPAKYNFPKGGVVSWADWAEVEHERWGLLDQELRREAEPDFLSEQAALWRKLQQENTGLRIWENGAIKCVSQAYYDDVIQAEIDRQPEEFHEAQLIGNLIGTQLRMPDTWIAERIETMIAAGQLCITWEENPGSRSYRRRLKKVHETFHFQNG